jgi:tryptophan synthase alpha chain
MNRLAARFDDLMRTGRRALLPYITAGYPDCATTLEILRRIPTDSCACVELGIPFSDPIADGPVIQASFVRALERGFRLAPLWEALRAERNSIAVPLLAMVSFSIVYRRGVVRFLDDAAAAGIDGLIVPDLALEAADDLAGQAAQRGCPLVLMAAPTSPPERRRRIAALSAPFVYYQSTAGVTGERGTLPPDLEANVRELRAASAKPVCVGFGISRPEHVAAVCRVADGAIVGSAIVRKMNAAVERGERLKAVADEVDAVVQALSAGLPRPAPPLPHAVP